MPISLVASLPDDELLDRFQRAAFGYFLENVNPDNGLVADTSRAHAPASIAVVGFALSCYPVAVERGWMTRAEAADLTRTTLDFLWTSRHGAGTNVTGHHGFFYHFLDMQTGLRTWNCELSMVDTALLMAGVLVSGAYFRDLDDGAETEIRALAAALYERVDWGWAQDRQATLRLGWKPGRGFMPCGWDGYNEAMILYMLAIGSPTHPISGESYAGWTESYQWETLYGREMLYGGPLFMHQFSHAWIDFEGIRDAFMRDHASDYFENSRRATHLHRDYAIDNPNGYEGYGADLWGLSAYDGPGSLRATVAGRRRKFFGYAARGAPFGPDDGTIAPWCCLGSLPFAPDICLSALRHLVTRHPGVMTDLRLPSAFNPTLANRRGHGADGWVSEGFYGLDQGLVVMMIENHRSRMIWDLLRASAPICNGLQRAGFSGGWLLDTGSDSLTSRRSASSR